MFGQVLGHLKVIKSVELFFLAFKTKMKYKLQPTRATFSGNFQCGRTRFFILVLEMERNRSENHPVHSNNVIVLLLRLNLLSPYQCSIFLFKVLPEMCWVHVVPVHLCSVLTEEHGDCHEVVLKSKCN